MRGTVKDWRAARGFGFIGRDDGGRDVFAHVRQVKAAGLEELKVGAAVEFEIAHDDHGRPHAVALRLVT